VSTLVVLELTVKGPNGLDAAVEPCGNEFKNSVTFALPLILLKSGKNLLTLKRNSPSPGTPALPFKSNSPDFIKEVIAVCVPSPLAWFIPTS
jgi:hypothetical protein